MNIKTIDDVKYLTENTEGVDMLSLCILMRSMYNVHLLMKSMDMSSQNRRTKVITTTLYDNNLLVFLKTTGVRYG